ncbi:NAD/NADP dependent alcohol dehydrogenase [Halocaridina rubra]|uniref:NAD/NADP dependent alcohol dehydrogenase n=1 Tax=Halocaridina rubra TaxID=373956 RepID=A0AAN8W961_HALRR
MASTKGKVIKCRAAVVWKVNTPYSIEEIEVAPPKAKEIRVKIIAAGVCRSDLSALVGLNKKVRFPAILGHEASGIVESVGSDITSVKEGDHVLASFVPQCNNCKFCKSPGTNLCVGFMKPPEGIGYMFDGTTRFSCKGKEVYQFIGCSTFTEYTVLDDGQFSKVRRDAPLEKISILSCGVTTGYGGPVNIAKVKPGSTCAVFGLGTVGLGAAMGCRVQGATRIIGVDVNNDKREIAKTFGVNEFCNPNDYDKPIQEVLKEITQGGCDYSFECIGSIKVVEAALDSVKLGTGTCVVIGVTPAGAKASIDPYQLLFGRVFTGCYLGGYRAQQVPGLVDDYMNKKIMVDEFITSTLHFTEVNKAFDMLKEGKTLKTVLTF